MQNMFKKLALAIFFFLLFSSYTSAESMQEENFQYSRAEILSTQLDENDRKMYLASFSDGREFLLDSYGRDLEKGDKVFVEHNGVDQYYYISLNRSPIIIVLILLFVFALVFLAGRKGLKALLSLFLSFILLFFVFIPMLVAGFDPIWTTLLFGTFVLAVSLFLTHGFNHQSLTSFLGSLSSIVFAAILLYLVVEFSRLSGLLSDDIQYLQLELGESLKMVRLVSAGIIIGILGVLDDITITQVAVVRELSSQKGISPYEIFKRALRVGRDHISSLVNTLVFAYIGATLPMIMLVSLMSTPWYILLSQEFIFIEIIRSLIGALALTLAVPITTWLASFVFLKSIHGDNCSVESACAHHHH